MVIHTQQVNDPLFGRKFLISEGNMKINTALKSLTAAAAIAISSMSFAADVGINANQNDLAIGGYDAVSYFKKGKPSKGKGKYTATHKGAIYHFTSTSNRDLFKASPEKYAPQFGGYCAMGVALNKKLDVDPYAWRIVDNKLYLNLNKDVQKKWASDIDGNLQSAYRNWNGIRTVSAEVLADE